MLPLPLLLGVERLLLFLRSQRVPSLLFDAAAIGDGFLAVRSVLGAAALRLLRSLDRGAARRL